MTTTLPEVDDLTRATAAAYDPDHDATAVPGELRSIIEAAINHQPRSQQKRIGPSEIGMECIRCLTHKLGGTPEKVDAAAWLPYIGTSVHEQLEDVFIQHEKVRGQLGMGHRFLPENTVTVGQVGGIDITGSTDLFDTHTGTVIDWKIVGTTTLRSVKANGASAVYRTQAMTYGKGWQDAGYPVHHVLIYFLPRNSVSLSEAVAWSAPYDRGVAEQALARANAVVDLIAAAGLDGALHVAGSHVNTGFSCRRYPDWQPTPKNPTDPFGS